MDERTVALIILMAGIGLLGSPIFALFVTPIFCFLRKIFFVPLVQNKILKKAIANGHMVTGRLQKKFDVNEHDAYGSSPTNYEMGIYIYEYKGKTYKFRADSATKLPDEITLYFQKNPRRATTCDTIGYLESNWLLYYLILCPIIAIVVFIVGMIYGINYI